MEILLALAIGALIAQQILHARERATLLDRIQSPGQVIASRAPDPSDEPLHVPYEDDDSYEDFLERVKNGEVT